MRRSLRVSAATLGSRGGRAGVGVSKRRGDSNFYRQLVALRKDRKVAGTAMEHRHLNHQDFTLAAIDDIIGNGGWSSWEQLRLALHRDARIHDKILRVCNVRVDDPSAQRYHFWRQYAQHTSTAR